MAHLVIEAPPSPPPKDYLIDKDFDNTINTYIEKSPITNKYRQENPNLRPMIEDEDDRLPSSSVYLTETVDPLSETKELPVDLSDTESTANSIKQRIRRFSLNQFSSNFSDSLNSKKLNRFSLNKSLNRLSTPSSASLQWGPYLAKSNNCSKTTLISSASFISDESDITRQVTPFWKYHILKFGKDLYLTTNPDLKHIYCRNGPGYYVEIIYPCKQRQTKLNNGFTLVFKDIAGIEPVSKDSRPPIMIITKKFESRGGYFTISFPRHSELSNGTIEYPPNRNKLAIFNGLSIPKKINSNFIPYDGTKQGKYQHYDFKNYEFKDFNNIRWNIGSIPRVRTSKMNKLKNKLKNTNNNHHEELNIENVNEVEYLKFIGKRNIYFHQNYIGEEEVSNSFDLLYKEKTNDPKKVYLHDSGAEFPPVLGLFRPYETKTRKRLIQTLNKNINKFQNKQSIPGKINNKILDHDIAAGSDIRKYYKGGDGLYFSTNPSDDSPDANKLGWITIYEDSRLFSRNENKAMFDIVVGLTLAVGFESCLDS